MSKKRKAPRPEWQRRILAHVEQLGAEGEPAPKKALAAAIGVRPESLSRYLRRKGFKCPDRHARAALAKIIPGIQFPGAWR